ncbi:MAG: TonB-dependent receptor plug domain-containing protein, partial [Muribaculaceae bacterium]|nr:TonB-dependent receptor plug domain-containing protein [Muribaculaceae bacterium]
MYIIKNKPTIIKWLQISCLTLASVLVFCGRAQATAIPAEPAQETAYEELHGHVIDSEGEALAGATVRLKGSQTGTSTNVDGNFTLRVPGGGDKTHTLIISFVGMLTQEVKVKNPAERILVKLQDDATVLSEVVVTGMDVIKKEHMTGAASVIQAKDLRMQGITSIDRILEGKIAGLNSSTVSGAPGSRAKITIRGENNLNGNSEPLWIVDGLPMTQGVPTSNTGNYAGTIMQDGVGNIMPEDIESISILKDASAAAIYGARAANGVIVITTKKGFRSKTQVSYTGTYEISLAPSRNLDFMNSAEKLQYEKSIIDNFGLRYAYLTGRGGYSYKRMVNGFITPQEYESEINRLSQINTDWFDVLFCTAHSNSHNISLRGGPAEITYYTSVNIQQKEGILMSNKYQSA